MVGAIPLIVEGLNPARNINFFPTSFSSINNVALPLTFHLKNCEFQSPPYKICKIFRVRDFRLLF